MIEIKQAVTAAIGHLKNLYDNPSGVQLEEVFQSDDGGSWLVTLSFLSKADPEGTLTIYGMIAQLNALSADSKLVRKFKTLEVDGKTGEVRSMKIRPVPSV